MSDRAAGLAKTNEEPRVQRGKQIAKIQNLRFSVYFDIILMNLILLRTVTVLCHRNNWLPSRLRPHE